MPLSRLNNFLKSVRGNIIYVNPNDLDSTDSIENQGNSLTRPFKTIQRALIEAARFSYQSGLDNDRFGKTTILVYPGDYVIDNRPGWIPYESGGSIKYKDRAGLTDLILSPYSLSSNFDLTYEDNDLYKLNSINGGVIVPRGTSIVGLDLRKTKIRPKYVPNPENDNIPRSSIFRVTGSCYFWQFSMFDADPNDVVYKDFSNSKFVPNFSHHKLSCFEYADGVNKVKIGSTEYDQTDLEMYYAKIADVYDQDSGRGISPDYPLGSIDVQPKIDEYRIVGSQGEQLQISNIKAGDGITATTTITVTTTTSATLIDVDSPIQISGVTASGYNGQYVVSEVVSSTQFKYKVQNPPTIATENPTNANVTLVMDTVTSASPYIFNVSLRSVFGMCGMLADGNTATGFKSMVVAQFTGIGLQKDDRAFLLYDKTTGTYQDSVTQPNLHSNSKAVFKPEYRNFHIKCTNDSFIQVVSVFAIGFADHLVVESGGDMSVTNSNSNFGSRSLLALGFKNNAFPRDDRGFITHIIPPKFIDNEETTIEFSSIDVSKTVSIASSSRLYLYNETNDKVIPNYIFDGYRIGNKQNDTLNVLISSGGTTEERSARIIMHNTAGSGNEITREKSFYISRGTTDTNQISSNTITLTQSHNFNNGETIRFIADNGDLFGGIKENTIYYAITSGVAANQIKIATSLSDALSGNAIEIYSTGGYTKVISKVSDKKSGDVGHPIQYDSVNANWYVNVATASTENNIYSTLVSLGTTSLGNATPRTYFKRTPESRNLVDSIYRYRYSVPKTFADTRPPVDGFVIQESNATGGQSTSEIQATTLTTQTDKKNYKFISDISYSSGTVTVTTEKPHKLTVGSTIEIVNVKSTSNTTGVSNKGYNVVSEVISVPSDKTFTYTLSSDPGTFTNNTNARTTQETPYVKRKKYSNTFYIYRTQEVKKQSYNTQDGVYHLITLNSSNNPSVNQFSDEGFSQRITDLYPQRDRDNPVSTAEPAKSYASSETIGKVITNELKNSITRESLNKFLVDNNIGVGITNIISSSTGIAHTIYTKVQHGLNPIIAVGIQSAGWKYGTGSSGTLYNASLTGSTTGESARANISIDANGAISTIDIIDGGSGYVVGDTLNIVGVATTAGHVVGVVSVTKIYSNLDDVINISGVSSSFYAAYNNLYRITSVPRSKEIVVTSTTPISGFSTIGLALTSNVISNSFYYNSGKSIGISSFVYNNTTGIATVSTSNPHGLDINNVVKIVGSGQTFYNQDFIVSRIIPAVSGASTSFDLKIGVSTTSPAVTGTLYAYKKDLFTSGGDTSSELENIGQRMSTIYAGITTSLNAAISNETTTTIEIVDVANSGLKLGDYIVIDEEIFRIASTIDSTTTNPITVFRGLFGTRANTHIVGSQVRKISIVPVELRRHSIIRASNHTFEYLGFGPGNYSTAFPDRQDRIVTNEESLLAQATKQDGGIVVFTGMNDKGDFYIGNKRVSSATGQEEIFDAPVPTVAGEDISSSGVNVGFDVLTPLEVSISRALRVEGGSKHDIVSEFNGPTVFGQKVTVNSQLETNSLLVQGEAKVSRKYTVGISTPSLAGNPGDVTYYSDPTKGNHLGWVFTKDNDWYRFGNISLSKDANINLFDKIGIGITQIYNNITFQVGVGTTSVVISGLGSVGIGSTIPTQKLDVLGAIKSSGPITLGSSISIGSSLFAQDVSGQVYVYGDGSNLTNINVSAAGWTNLTGILYNTALGNVGLGTTNPRFGVEIGAVGAGGTSLYVNNTAKFVGLVTANDVFVSGILTSSQFDLNGSSGRINAGIVTATTLNVGTAGTIITATSTGSIGIGTSIVRSGAVIDLEGRTRLSSYFETVNSITATSTSRVILDVSKFQNFVVTTDNVNIDGFDMINCPSSGSFSFTLVIVQGSTARTVDIQDFTRSTNATTGAPITGGTSAGQPRWNGGVEPTVTASANASDIYNFVTFDGGASLYGITGGQNFS